jgi:hypothetical protein
MEQYINFPPSSSFYTASQANRLLQINRCGNVRIYPLGSLNWRREADPPDAEPGMSVTD